MKRVTIDIDVDGTVKIHTEGFRGKECLKVTAELEKKMGKKVSDSPTAEYYENGQAQGVKQ